MAIKPMDYPNVKFRALLELADIILPIHRKHKLKSITGEKLGSHFQVDEIT